MTPKTALVEPGGGPTSPSSSAAPAVLIVFGATGDLMERKIAPSLYHLHERGRLPERFKVVAFARRELADDVFREMVCGSIRRHHGTDPDESDIHAFAASITYTQGHFDEPDAYARLAARLSAIDAEWGECANKIFYLAVPPGNYRSIIENLGAGGLNASCSPGGSAGGETRVVVEKPFGRDGAGARELDTLLCSMFGERQIYRIDHYLAKEMLQGVMSFRFSNNLFEPSWNNGSIARIEIDLLETLGAEARGAFYDGIGALRDVGQNHLLQMLALVTMEHPVSMGADAIRAARAAALEALRPLSPEQVGQATFRAQYDGYRDIAGIAPGSTTETFFKIVTELDSDAWRGVPIVMRAGKRMDTVCKRIVVAYKRPEPCLCSGADRVENRVTFALDPADSITIGFWTKMPGFDDVLEERDFNFMLYEKQEKTQYVEEYARLFVDIIAGDQTLFVSAREVEAMWAFTDPIVQGWADGLAPLESYRPDTAEALAASAGVRGEMSPHGGLRREIGVVGLGRMGAGIARNLLDHRWRVVGFNRSARATETLASEGLVPAGSLAELVAKLEPPRAVWLMLPAGAAVDEVLFGVDGLATLLSRGDTVIDGGNTHFIDDASRADRLAESGIRFVDVGVSGGPWGARLGACLLVGSGVEDFDRLTPLWSDLAVEGGYRHFEGVGAGHFVKMVHNGIEYGMMQAIAEGFTVLRESPYSLDLTGVADVFNHGSVVQSRLIGWLEEGLQQHGQDLEGVSGTVGHTGEGAWTVEAAREQGVKARVIEEAVAFRLRSEETPDWTGRVLSALREQFGRHPVGEPGRPGST